MNGNHYFMTYLMQFFDMVENGAYLLSTCSSQNSHHNKYIGARSQIGLHFHVKPHLLYGCIL